MKHINEHKNLSRSALFLLLTIVLVCLTAFGRNPLFGFAAVFIPVANIIGILFAIGSKSLKESPWSTVVLIIGILMFVVLLVYSFNAFEAAING